MLAYKHRASQKDSGSCSFAVCGDERGVAFLTVMMVMFMMTVLGIAAITASSLENKMAGLQRTVESSGQAAESCLGTSANVVLQALLPESGGMIPASLQSSAGGPVPTANATTLANEISGNISNSIDVASGVGPNGQAAAPNIQMNVGVYTVVGDIDRLYIKQRAGSGQQQFAAYDGAGVGSNAYDVFYRFSCTATNSATGTEGRVSALYTCALTGDGCQRQPS